MIANGVTSVSRGDIDKDRRAARRPLPLPAWRQTFKHRDPTQPASIIAVFAVLRPGTDTNQDGRFASQPISAASADQHRGDEQRGTDQDVSPAHGPRDGASMQVDALHDSSTQLLVAPRLA